MCIRIGIVDDHVLLCDGIKNLIQQNTNDIVVFQAANGKECLEYLEDSEYTIDVLLLDIVMSDMNGYQVLEEIQKKYFHVRTIFLTSFDDSFHFCKALDLGIDGYLLKNIDYKELLFAISQVGKGLNYFDKRLEPILTEYVSNIDFKRNVFLTNREKEILSHVADGMSNKEIAYTLKIREETVKNHLSNVFHKFQVNDRTQAVLHAWKNHYLDL